MCGFGKHTSMAYDQAVICDTLMCLAHSHFSVQTVRLKIENLNIKTFVISWHQIFERLEGLATLKDEFREAVVR